MHTVAVFFYLYDDASKGFAAAYTGNIIISLLLKFFSPSMLVFVFKLVWLISY